MRKKPLTRVKNRMERKLKRKLRKKQSRGGVNGFYLFTKRQERKIRKRQKKKNKSPLGNLLLETSVFIKGASNNNFKKFIKDFTKGYSVCSSNFCLYEYKMGLIRVIIDFYVFIKTYTGDVPDAIDEWNNKCFGIRELKYKDKIQPIMARMYNSINYQNKEEYLNRLEIIIGSLVRLFMADIKNLVGDFGDNDVIKFNIDRKEDYKSFLAVCENNEYMKLGDFWEENHEDFLMYIKNEAEFKGSALKRIYKSLKNIDKNKKYADMHKTCLALGDAVIAVDCPKSYKIITLDKAFNVLATLIDKRIGLVEKDGAGYAVNK
ncbi:hypothetical protein K8R42_04320 [bacterium]|nr:hypothetical protein [bacterium]